MTKQKSLPAQAPQGKYLKEKRQSAKVATDICKVWKNDLTLR